MPALCVSLLFAIQRFCGSRPRFQIKLSFEVRLSYARTLPRLEPGCAGTIPVLIEALKDRDATPFENSTFRTLAAEALGMLGPLAREAEPLLRSPFPNDDYHFAEVAQAALSRINQSGLTPKSTEVLLSPP